MFKLQTCVLLIYYASGFKCTFTSVASVFQSLAAENIVLVNRKAINDIELDSIVLKGYEGTIMGTKTFDRLTTYEADTERLGKVC